MGVAVQLMRSFVNEVNAQSGKHIDSMHAGHLAEHAQNVIVAMGG